MISADVWWSLNVKWLLYSTPFLQCQKANPNWHMCLTGTNADTLIRCVGKVNYPAMRRFSEILRERIKEAHNVRMVSQDGDEITFVNVPDALFPANWAMPACREHICS